MGHRSPHAAEAEVRAKSPGANQGEGIRGGLVGTFHTTIRGLVRDRSTSLSGWRIS
eukprot:CAMPEP_0197413308 /NCGR_PEP_ID=MMETSP1170-20131217/192_1 /TAXON_ID=54406 /ORGANISM="Sarcinochrysis sp, Strain CCMP770" /LENGTH=55 /DNA_ID=CAMNT_0042939863 /DNA_START=25 /DNA_END=192 /DNA_ORIENTATION=+